MKFYYKLMVTATIPEDMKVAYVHAFQLMETCHGRKWITFCGITDDIETACDLLNAEGITAKKTFMRIKKNA